jgi:hypothetical protein
MESSNIGKMLEVYKILYDSENIELIGRSGINYRSKRFAKVELIPCFF